ncbi:MAG TPA: penicillin-binding protein, partial [Rubricoccaceae bacterium]|nr:penicillin-binding protein [Rubricoccaceae bacterium]
MSARETILSRLYVALAALLVLPVGVVVQMGRIHLGDGAELRERGARQAASFVEVPATRGSIYDRAGRALVVNTARYDVAADPTVEGFDARAEELYETLGRLTGRGAAHFRRRVANRASRQYVLLTRNLGEVEKEALDAEGFPGLLVTGTFARRYNYTRAASHLLGHVDPDGR